MVCASFRRLIVFSLIVVITLQVTPLLAAQQTQDAPAPQPATPSPPKEEPSQWHGGVMLGLTLQSGVSDQRGVNLGGALFRRWGDWGAVLELSYSYADVKFGAVEQTVANVQNHRILARRTLTPRTFLLFRPSYKRNTVQQVDYRLEELGGVGVRLVHHKGFTLNAVPVIGAVQQRKNIPAVDGATGTGGIFQSAEYTITKVWSFQQFFLYLRDFRSDNDSRVQVNAQVNGKIRGPVGLTLTYTFDRENVVVDASEKGDQRLVAGVNVTF